ncbi:MAG: hypothetical protein ABIH18_04115 [Candidatus Omnitrophota bacterium]
MNRVINSNKGLSILNIIILLVFVFFLYIIITRPKPASVEKKKDIFSEQGIDRSSKEAVINSMVNKYKEIDKQRFEDIEDLQNNQR